MKFIFTLLSLVAMLCGVALLCVALGAYLEGASVWLWLCAPGLVCLVAGYRCMGLVDDEEMRYVDMYR